MIDPEEFEAVFGSNKNISYDAKTVEKIQANRDKVGGELMVEKLLKTLGVDAASKLYPPKSNDSLRELHSKIAASASPDHYKHSVTYYLLKDATGKNQRIAQDFAKAVYLPAKYETFVNGIWLLDRRKYEEALDYLTEPSLTPTFPEDILYVLCQDTRPQDFYLPIAYYNCVAPSLGSEKVVKAYFSVLCRANLTEAFFFHRIQGDHHKDSLFDQLIEHALSEKDARKRSDQCFELVSLPFTDQEEERFGLFLQSGNGSKLQGASDTVIMRGSLLGKAKTSTKKMSQLSSQSIDGVSWDTISGGMQGVPG